MINILNYKLKMMAGVTGNKEFLGKTHNIKSSIRNTVSWDDIQYFSSSSQLVHQEVYSDE